MAHMIINLQGSRVESVQIDAEDTVRVRLVPAVVIKSQGIAGVDASTRWEQAATVSLREAEVSGAVPAGGGLVADGSLECGGFKYLGMVPLPLDSSTGYAVLRVRLESGELVVVGHDADLHLEGQPRYVEHIRETQPPG
jgi:hypothetical protein